MVKQNNRTGRTAYVAPGFDALPVCGGAVLCQSPSEGGTPGDALCPDDDNTWNI